MTVALVAQSASSGDSVGRASLVAVGHGAQADLGTAQRDTALRLAFLAVLLYLLALSNVANLSLARAARRRSESALQIALGARPARLLRAAIFEHLTIAVLAALLACFACVWTGAVLREGVIPGIQWRESIVSLRMGAFVFSMTILASVSLGAWDARYLGVPRLGVLLAARSGDISRSYAKTAYAYLVPLSAICTLLLVAAGLIAKSLWEVESINLGYDVPNIVLASVAANADMPRFDQSDGAKLASLVDGIGRISGVTSAALADVLPTRGMQYATVYYADGRPVAKLNGQVALLTAISPEYFKAVGVRIKTGRPIEDIDGPGGSPVVVISATMAHALWAADNAIGRCIKLTSASAPCATIVGIASDAHYLRFVEDPSMHVYMPLAQAVPRFPRGIVIRVAEPKDASGVSRAVAGMLATAFGGLGVPIAQPMSEYLEPQLKPWRVNSFLFSSVAALGLLLAVVGVFTTVTYSVESGRREIGIRMALGASPKRLVLKSCLAGGEDAIGWCHDRGRVELGVRSRGWRRNSMRQEHTILRLWPASWRSWCSPVR